MCDACEGKFVVPTRPSAQMGWWVGQVVKAKGKFYEINLLWVEVPEYSGNNTIGSTAQYVKEFDNPAEALEHLKSKGVLAPPVCLIFRP